MYVEAIDAGFTWRYILNSARDELVTLHDEL